jgi:hypothetical protein
VEKLIRAVKCSRETVHVPLGTTHGSIASELVLVLGAVEIFRNTPPRTNLPFATNMQRTGAVPMNAGGSSVKETECNIERPAGNEIMRLLLCWVVRKDIDVVPPPQDIQHRGPKVVQSVEEDAAVDGRWWVIMSLLGVSRRRDHALVTN